MEGGVMLTRKQKITAYIAKWIVVEIAGRINSIAVLSLCIETARVYNETGLEQWLAHFFELVIMITEILETRETPDGKYVRFKTGNSEYEWNSF